MPVKGGYLLTAGVGALVLWSGMRGKSWSSVLQALIRGQDPRNLPNAEKIQGAPVSSSTGGTGSSLPGPITEPVSTKERAVWAAMLVSAGAPPTPANIRSLVAWRTHESPWNADPPDGALHTHNPLNTTLKTGSIGTINSAGVAIYPNWAVGIKATVETWFGYPEILGRLRSGRGLCGFTSSEFSKWSGGGYSSVC